MQRYLSILPMIAVFALLCSCDQWSLRNRRGSELRDVVADTYGAYLGAGYASALKKLVSTANQPCVVGRSDKPFEFFPSPMATLATKFSRDYDYHYQELKFNVGGGVGVLQAETEMVDALEHSELSLALLTNFDYNFGTLSLAQPKLTDYARDRVSDATRARDCGDEFVDQIDLGANFTTAVVFHFKDKATNFKLALKVILDLFLAKVTLAEIGIKNNNYDAETSLDLKVTQTGGDQAQFADLKKSVETEGCASIKLVSQMKTDYLPQLEECLKKYNQALEYGRNQFSQQLAEAKAAPFTNQGIGTMAIREVRTRRYADAGFWWYQPDAKINGDIAAINRLMEQLNKETSYFRGAELSLHAIVKDHERGAKRAFTLNEEEFKRAELSLACAQHTLEKLAAAAKTCADRSTESSASCLDALNHMRLQALPYFKVDGTRKPVWPEDECAN